jgi:hypothetical protein
MKTTNTPEFESQLYLICREEWDKELLVNPNIPNKISFEDFAEEVWDEMDENELAAMSA